MRIVKKVSVRRLAPLVLAAGLALGSTPASAQTIPDVPVPDLPQPPEQLKPLLGAPSPTIFQACQAEATVLSLIQTAAVVGGAPVNPGLLLAPVRQALPLRQACGYFRISVVPPTCGVDANIPALPVTVPRPASLAAAQVRAIEKAAMQMGAPLNYMVSSPVYGNLGCR